MINVQYLQIVLHLAVAVDAIDALGNHLEEVEHKLIVITLLTIGSHAEADVMVFGGIDVGLANNLAECSSFTQEEILAATT